MPLDCRICCLLYLLTVAVRGFDHSPLDIDKALNPRLVGAIYQLYKPTQAPPKVPISIDCNHPDVICRFGTGALLTTTGTKECNCKEPTGNVPIITGLVTPQVNKNSDIQNIKTGEATVPLKSTEKEKEVPVYHGIIDTEAVLNEADRPYNIWNFQRNSLERGWRASQNPIKPRVGELPRKFYSYYPFSDPPLSEEYYTQLSQSIPDPDDDDDDFFPFSKHSGSVSHQKTTKRPPTTVTVINPTISDTRKTSGVKGGNVKS